VVVDVIGVHAFWWGEKTQTNKGNSVPQYPELNIKESIVVVVWNKQYNGHFSLTPSFWWLAV
jgi:hypothetical protein